VGDIEAVARQCIFTTHTPVSGRARRFPAALVRETLGARARPRCSTRRMV
jgi:glucan phosphorylase